MCFTSSVQEVMKEDHNVFLNMEPMVETIYYHMADKYEEYVNFYHPVSKQKYMEDVTHFFVDNDYTSEIMNLIVPATADALGIQLVIFQEMRASDPVTKTPLPSRMQKQVYGANLGRPLVHVQLEGEGVDGHYSALILLESAVKKAAREEEMKKLSQSLMEEGEEEMSEQEEVDLYHQFDDVTEDEEVEVVMVVDSDEEVEGQSGKGVETGEVEVVGKKKTDKKAAGPSDFREEDIITFCEQEHIAHSSERVHFPEYLFVDVEPEYVDKIPDDIDGKKKYIIKNVTEDTWLKAQRDRRHFLMTTSKQKGLVGKRKIGWCAGSLICENEDCTFYNHTTERNCYNFTHKRNPMLRVCFSCEAVGTERLCMGRKLTIFDRQAKTLTVLHINKHTCSLRQDLSKDDEFMRNLVEENPDLPASALTKKHLRKLFREKDFAGMMSESEKFANTRRFRYLIKKYRQEQAQYPTSEHSWDAVRILRKQVEEIDPFFIYSMNVEDTNDKPGYIFKSSRQAMELAALMDSDIVSDNPM